MPESFGARLRQQRERQQIALATIADQTKISLSLLEALERDDTSHWPAGIFRRAFVRAYAHAIGLEPGVVLREFLELHPDRTEEMATPAAIAPSVELNAGLFTPLQYLARSVTRCLARLRPPVAQRRKSVADHPMAADRTPMEPPVESEPDFLAAAHLCTEFGRINGAGEAVPLLQKVVRILNACGLIVWVWDPLARELRPALAHGYSDKVLAQLPKVGHDADNATAAAFRVPQTRLVKGSDLASGALVVPLITSVGCVGVLAIELQNGREQSDSVRALATIFASQLARVVGIARSDETADRRLALA
jgi:transcriptional regulator with XRE-family HTH domain